MEYIYHLMPEAMEGKTLYSLNQLKEESPKLAKDYLKTYKGREKLLNKKIPPLDCSWSDVIFLSCLNPVIIFNAMEVLGLLAEKVPTILKFPASVLKDKEFCFMEEGTKIKFFPGNLDSYEEESHLPYETAKYFVSCIKKEEDPLIFSGIKHVLLKGNLDLSQGQKIKYQHLLE